MMATTAYSIRTHIDYVKGISSGGYVFTVELNFGNGWEVYDSGYANTQNGAISALVVILSRLAG